MKTKLLPSQIKLADLIGKFIEYWGFKSAHGRIWTVIFLAKEPVNAKYLVENLGVSKALISMSIKDLLYYNVIEEVKKDGPSTQKYTYNKEIFEVITNVLKNRESQLLRDINSQITKVTDCESDKINDPVSKDQLGALKDMSETAEKALTALVNIDKINIKEIVSVLNL